MSTLARVTDATVEPVTLDEAKAQVRVDAGETSEDALLTTFIGAARGWIESETNRALIQQTWRYSLDEFPRLDGAALAVAAYSDSYGYGGGYGYGSQRTRERLFDGTRIRLPMPNLLAVMSIIYVDPSGQPVTMDPSAYDVDTDALPGCVTPAFGTSWPPTRFQPSAVRILYTAGFGASAADVPQELRAAVLLGVEDLNRNRGAQTDQVLAQNDTIRRLMGRHVYRDA